MPLDGGEQAIARRDRRRLGEGRSAQRRQRQDAGGDAKGSGRRGP
ncbi:MAG: hypothetical protein OXI75_09820 [Rhodospirillales bacterium]|nr:hypothetical protein [Rhodospirillales bacterium]